MLARMITKAQYVEYLLSTPGNVTGTYLADQLDGVSHDTVSDFLRQKPFTARQLWQLVRDRICDDPSGCLIVDDSVHNKRYSRFIELVKRQYSGTEHGLVRGIGVVNLVHSTGINGDFWPIDYRIYAPETDGKTKNDHFFDMVTNAVHQKQIQAKTILFDTWYASVANLKLVHHLGLLFWTTIKDNRRVSLSRTSGYIPVYAIQWTDAEMQHGIRVKLKELPFHVRLFKIVAPNGDIDWAITNDPDETLTTQAAEDASDVRWQIEEFHRGVKQLTNSEHCQARKARSQRNHLACCYHAWISLKVAADHQHTTLYAVRQALFADYLRAELRNPRIKAV